MTPSNSDASSFLVDSVTSGLSITRWNNYPRVREITSLDHLAFVAHTSLITALSSGEDYDIGLMLRKVMFSGFFTFKYSDMSSELKHRLRMLYPDLYHILEQGVMTSLLEADAPEAMKHDIESAFTPSKEDDIISFVKTWSSYYEIYNNSLVYPDAYADLLDSIKTRSLAIQVPEKISEILDFTPGTQNDIEKFLIIVHRLASNFRWNRSIRSARVSVFAHTYLIMFFTYYIGVLEGLEYDEITDMMMTALYHDLPETITGDVITPTKKAIPGLAEAIEHIEKDMVHESLLSYIEKTGFQDIIARKMLNPWDEKYGKLVKLADNVSAYHEARVEGVYNEHFVEVAGRLEKILLDSKKDYVMRLMGKYGNL